jgi:hypothetical protein
MFSTSKLNFYFNTLILLAIVSAAVYFKYLLELNHSSSQSLKNKTVLRLFLPRENKPNDDSFLVMFSEKFLLNQMKKKKLMKIDLTGNYQQDLKRFEFIRHEARRLKYTYDTTAVIQVHFMDENTYEQFVYLVNMMADDQHKRWAILNDDFYILGENPPVIDSIKIKMLDM